ncbi:hypothetical protein OEZ86_001723 [Tetradesmus obliquus]|nr:hypothetical protein OEZ86_001723 [Tetradesmus obliquus]
MSQSLYRELHPPTAISHCVEAFFTHAASKQQGAAVAPNLVVARGTRLEVFSLNYGATPANSSSSSSSSHPSLCVPPAVVLHCRLELVGSWQCWGLIEDLAVLRGRGSSGQRDSLVLAVRDAKVALVEWDDKLHCLRNGSLHSFEGDPSLWEGCPCGTGMTLTSSSGSFSSTSSHLAGPPMVAADPNGRCAAALVYGRHLALLPAFQADVMEMLVQEGSTPKGSTSCASVGNSYLVNLAKVSSLKLASDCAVRAMTFLHGYTEPVLLLLHETAPTWGGRLREARDTCALSAMSINVRKKRQPVIWHVPGLPSDCSGLLAVPRGGVLVLSQNLLLYHAQGGSCVMAINSNAFAGEVPPKLDIPGPPIFPPFPPRTAAEIQAATTAAAEKAANAAAAHARQWAVNVHPETVAAAAKGAPKAPGMELEADGAVGCWLAGNVALLSLKTGQLLLVALKFEGSAASKMQVVVAGAGPVASCAATLTSNLLFLGSAVGDALLVRYTSDAAAASLAAAGSHAGGYDRSGSFGNSSSSEPPGKRRRLAGEDAAGMLDEAADAAAAAAAVGGDGFGVSLEEAGELFHCAMGRSHSAVMPVLLGEGLRQNLKVLDSLLCLGPMRSSAIADLQLRESDVHALLSNSAAAHKPKPSSCLIAAVGSDKCGALAIMRRGLVADVITAVPSLQAHGAWTLHHRPSSRPASTAAAAAADADDGGGGDEAQAGTGGLKAAAAAEDEDEASRVELSEQHHAFVLLSCGGSSTMVLDAGGAELSELSEDVAFERNAPTLTVGEFFNATAAVQVTHTAVRLVFALPSMACVFEDAEAVLGHQTLSPARPPSPYADEDGEQDADLAPSPVSELLMECFAGSSGGAVGVAAAAAPLLVMLRDDGSCLAYKAFKPQAASSPLGFRRLSLDADLLPHLSPVQPPADAAKAQQLPAPAPGMPQPSAPPCRLIRFDHLATPRLEAPLGPGFVAKQGSDGSNSSGAALPLPQLRYSGVFVCGPRPVWLVASRGGFVVHPMEADVGQVDAFCAFHNLNCVHGYMAASLAGALNICTLPLQMRLDQPWLVSKLPLRATPQALAYYPEARLLAVTTSRLPMWRYPLLPGETVTALKHVSLCEGGDENANPQPFLAVGCSSVYGEDYPALGRVLLFQVLKEKIFRVEGSSQVISGRLELQREYPGPVTAVESLRGFLLMAIGNKLEMHYKQGNSLVKVTFFDGLQLVCGLALVKDFLLLGQAGHSAAFFRYNCAPDPVTRERQQQLQELSADTERLDAWAVEFMPNGAKLSQVLADGGGNLTVFMYDMKNPDSWLGKKLLRRGVAHVGAWISQFQRLRLAVPGDSLNRQGLLGCSAQGSLLLLCPLWEEGMFRRLQSLQEELVYQLRHTAGLNPKAFQGRYTRAGPTWGAGFTAVKPLKPLDNWLLQGDLLWSYAGLDLRAQMVIAEAVGVEPAMLLQDLRTLSIAANFL